MRDTINPQTLSFLWWKGKKQKAPSLRNSIDVSNSWPAAIRRTTLLMPEWRVGSVSKAFPYLGSFIKKKKYDINASFLNCGKLCMAKFGIPIAGLVSAGLISERWAHEHVLVDASTQAVDIWCHLVPWLHNWQNFFQSLFTISGLIPPRMGICHNRPLWW